jgi:tRNA-dependent cyclodipeptide synthase
LIIYGSWRANDMSKEKYIIKRITYVPKKNVDTWSSGAYLSVSINNRHYKDEKSLRQIFKFLSENKLKYDVIIGDYTHRHNQRIFDGDSMEDALKISLKKGEEIIQTLNHVAKSFPNIKLKIRRTAEFYSRQEFSRRIEQFNKLLLHDKKFAESVELTINKFLNRIKRSFLNIYETKTLCKDYILEELVIYELLSSENLKTNIYPGNHLPVLKEIVRGNLPGISKNLEKINLVELKFIKSESQWQL